MKSSRFRPFVCLLFALTVLHQPPASSLEREALRMLRQFQRQSLGLMDMSTDGRLLLLHQYLRERSPAGARLERLHVIDEPSGREIAALTLESAQLRTMLFLPSGHQVLVSGSLVEPAAGRGFLLWDPRSGKSRVLGGLDPDDFTFIQFLDAARILGKRSETKGGNPHAPGAVISSRA